MNIPDAPLPQPQKAARASLPDNHPDRLRTEPRLLVDVRRLSEISEARGLAAIAVQWTVILLTITIWWNLPADLGVVRWLLYAVAVIIIGSRQHALLILMHEGAHSRLSKDKARNEFYGDMFCAFPVGLSTELYRRRHLKHHKHTNTSEDPDWTIIEPYEDWHWPKDNIAALKLFASDLIGMGAHKILFTFMLWSPARKLFFKRQLKLAPAERLRLIAFCTCAVALFSICHLWLAFFMFWLVPFLTALVPISRFRTVAEHMVVESEHELNKTRHVDCTPFERMVVAPLNVNYHLTHHLYPSIPFYNLPEMHRILLKEELFRDNAHVTTGYWGVRESLWQELTQPKAHHA